MALLPVPSAAPALLPPVATVQRDESKAGATLDQFADSARDGPAGAPFELLAACIAANANGATASPCCLTARK